MTRKQAKDLMLYALRKERMQACHFRMFKRTWTGRYEVLRNVGYYLRRALDLV